METIKQFIALLKENNAYDLFLSHSKLKESELIYKLKELEPMYFVSNIFYWGENHSYWSAMDVVWNKILNKKYRD